jgi:hypothetical protein
MSKFLATILLALASTACSAGTVSPSQEPSSSSTATASPTLPATPSALPEGTYQTAPIPTATLKATAEAAGFTWDASRWTAKTTVYSIKLENGLWNWFCASDGAPPDTCARGTYEVTDDHTIAYTDLEDPSSGFILTFSLDGDALATHVDPGPGAGIEAIIFYNSAPFVRQP